MSDIDSELPTVLGSDTAEEVEEILLEATGLAAHIHGKFQEAEDGRRTDEERWRQSFNDYRGRPDDSKAIRAGEKSKVFVKIPKTKTLAAYGQLVEVVFAANKFPLGIKPTEVPEGISEFAHANPGAAAPTTPAPEFGFPGDGERPGEKLSVFGNLAAKFPGINFKPGPAKTADEVQIKPAEMAARRMEKNIRDQLTESHASRELRKALFEASLYGTGVVKGPFTVEKTIHRWSSTADDEGNPTKSYTPTDVLVPRIEYVSVWDFYPDPAATDVASSQYIIQRHGLNKSQFRALLKRPFFIRDAVNRCLERGANYIKRGYEDSLKTNDPDGIENTRWEIIEFWGVVDTQMALEAGIEFSDSADASDEVEVNVWVCEDEIIRIVANPFEPERIPYHAFPYEVNPHEFFGVGVPENMSDSTMMMNGHVRMAIDNLALAGNLVFDIDESSLVQGQPTDIYPGKVFRRQSGQPGAAIHSIKFQSTTQENMLVFDRFRQFADEETGIPSFSHGQTGVQSTTRTASGMSMLMGAAALSIKTVVKNLDDYLLQPLGESMYYWNMQFGKDLEAEGDLSVKALGTESLIQKEVRSQRLIQFLQITANPALAPFAKIPYIIKEIAHSLDLDSDEIVNDIEQAKLFAQIIGQAGQLQGPANSVEGQGSGGTVGEVAPQTPAMPGEDEFSGVIGPPNAPA
tara:strand:- start:5615 stop:7678 length:2064 start_codon:yes stop_codon:yes gene_type:complete